MSSASQSIFKDNFEEILSSLKAFLSFQSISADPAYKKHVLDCGKWLKKHIENIGLTVDVLETKGFPILYAHDLNAGPDKPTILIYSHYDVQPVDPLDLWDTPPFEPDIREGKIFARGAADNKGQLIYVFFAIKHYLEKKGSFPFNIKWIIEGEEEIGSPNFFEILKTKKEIFKADYALLVDSGILDENTPAVTLGCRGICHFSLNLKGSNTDLHSGIHGGVAFNPIHALVKVLASLRDDHGKITIDGFYDDVDELSREEKESINFDFDFGLYKQQFGAEANGGEVNYSPTESEQIRPTLEINGICGGYTGEGFKTVIPALSHVKISCRLVPNQDPNKILKLVRDQIKKELPKGIEATFDLDTNPAKAFRTPPNSKIVKMISHAFEQVFEKKCEKILTGGSLPIADSLQKACGGEFIALGTALATDKIHAPNEHFCLKRFEKGHHVLYSFFDSF